MGATTPAPAAGTQAAPDEPVRPPTEGRAEQRAEQPAEGLAEVPADLAVVPPFLQGLARLAPADPEAVRPEPADVADLRALLVAALTARARDLPGAPGCVAFGVLARPDDLVLGPAAHAAVAKPADGVRTVTGVGLLGPVGAAAAAPAGRVVVTVVDAGHLDDADPQLALTTACRLGVEEEPLPWLLVVDDTAAREDEPVGWVRSQLDGRLGLEYLALDASDPLGLLAGARWALATVRTRRCPIAVHLGAAHPPRPEGDPLAALARGLVRRGVVSADEVIALWNAVVLAGGTPDDAAGTSVDTGGEGADDADGAARADAVRARVERAAEADARSAAFPDGLPESRGGLGLADSLDCALVDAVLADPGLRVLGVPSGSAVPASAVLAIPGQAWVRVGAGLGVASAGGAAVVALSGPADLLHVAPLLQAGPGGAGRAGGPDGAVGAGGVVLRVPVPDAGAVPWAWLRGLDGGSGRWRVACPAHPSDAAALLRSCLAHVAVTGGSAVLLEPASLAAEADMVREGDGAWRAPYPPPSLWPLTHVPVGRAARWGGGDAVTVVTAGAPLRTVLRAVTSADGAGPPLRARVVDLRWLLPLPVQDVLEEARASGRLLVVEPFPGVPGVAEPLLAEVLDAGFEGRVARLDATADPRRVAAAVAALLSDR
ncbi:MAG: transketolase C-terminal domain-containing protein [Kineosporiaceae bacterium]